MTFVLFEEMKYNKAMEKKCTRTANPKMDSVSVRCVCVLFISVLFISVFSSKRSVVLNLFACPYILDIVPTAFD
jgi:hypothetical protein